MDEQDRGNFEPLDSDQPPVTAGPASAEEYAAESRQAGNRIPMPPPSDANAPNYDKQGGHKNLIISIGALIVLALLAGSIYWFSLRHKPTTTPNSAQANAGAQKPAANNGLIDQSTKKYTSTNLNLSFTYPADWTVNDNGGGIMSVKSPILNLTVVSGNQQGAILLTIRDHAQTLSEFVKGSATATRDSQKIAYTNPTSSQRANTYLSFLQYSSTTTNGALDGIYITGDNGYQKGQNVPGSDVGKADPRISLTFTDASGKAISIADKAWDDTNFSGPLTTMLQSFSIN